MLFPLVMHNRIRGTRREIQNHKDESRRMTAQAHDKKGDGGGLLKGEGLSRDFYSKGRGYGGGMGE